MPPVGEKSYVMTLIKLNNGCDGDYIVDMLSMTTFNCKRTYEKLAVVLHPVQNTQRLGHFTLCFGDDR